MAGKLMVVLGCDCDPDRPRYGGTRYDTHRSPLKWRGLNEGLRFLLERLERIKSAVGVTTKMVFFLRSDVQIKEICGGAAWSVLEYADTWRRLEEEGHELAWHPHLWRWNPEWGCWFQETKDADWVSECLEVGFSEISEALGKSPVTSHMGWTFHDNVTMNKLSELGLKVDFSASPGVYSGGGPGVAGTKFDNMIDWLGTPRGWYRPSEADYRRPARGGENELGIVEIPKFTSRSSVLRKAKDLASRGGKGKGATTGTAAFVQVTAPPMLFNRVISERLQTEEAEPFFVTYFHPDELLSDRSRSVRGFIYSLDNLEKNILKIINAAAKKGRDVEFVTGAEAFRYICKEGKG